MQKGIQAASGTQAAVDTSPVGILPVVGTQSVGGTHSVVDTHSGVGNLGKELDLEVGLVLLGMAAAREEGPEVLTQRRDIIILVSMLGLALVYFDC